MALILLRRRHVYFLAAILINFVLLSILAYLIMNSRSFQFFGGLIQHVKTNEKVVALTFDDGPKPGNTEQILEILRKENAKATFMLVGSEIEKYPDQTKLIIRDGHQIGNHSYSHQRMVFKPLDFYKSEIEKTDAAIRKAGYMDEIVFRPPNGKRLLGLPYYLSQNKRKTIMWDVEPESEIHASASSQTIASSAVKDTRPGSIILLHVMFESRDLSMDAVESIIRILKADGYTFVTVNELLAHAK